MHLWMLLTTLRVYVRAESDRDGKYEYADEQN